MSQSINGFLAEPETHVNIGALGYTQAEVFKLHK